MIQKDLLLIAIENRRLAYTEKKILTDNDRYRILMPTVLFHISFTSNFKNNFSTAIFSPSTATLRPLTATIFPRPFIFETATFEESGRDDGHLATLFLGPVAEHPVVTSSKLSREERDRLDAP
jgi:hypothetical protein